MFKGYKAIIKFKVKRFCLQLLSVLMNSFEFFLI